MELSFNLALKVDWFKEIINQINWGWLLLIPPFWHIAGVEGFFTISESIIFRG